MTTSIRSGISDAGILINGVEEVTIDSSGISLGAGKRLAQIQTFVTGTLATGTTILPADNTIPQNTEGDQYMSLTITPTNINSTLEIDVNIEAGHTANVAISTALFQDTIANALSATTGSNSAAGAVVSHTLKYFMTAGTISATTFKVRIGASAAGTLSFNGVAGVQLFGGIINSRITIKEWLP